MLWPLLLAGTFGAAVATVASPGSSAPPQALGAWGGSGLVAAWSSITARATPWAGRPEQIGAVQGRIGRLSVGEAQAFLQGGLVGLNRYQLRVMGVQPVSRALHEGRVVYDRRDPTEHWRSIREIWEAGDGISGPAGVGRGDCEDLAAALAAELAEAGYPAEVVIAPVRPGLSHAIVKVIATGELFDPSRTGGMGWEREHRARFGLVDGPPRGGNVATRTPPPRLGEDGRHGPWCPPLTHCTRPSIRQPRLGEAVDVAPVDEDLEPAPAGPPPATLRRPPISGRHRRRR
jgi:hypothetical protein